MPGRNQTRPGQVRDRFWVCWALKGNRPPVPFERKGRQRVGVGETREVSYGRGERKDTKSNQSIKSDKLQVRQT